MATVLRYAAYERTPKPTSVGEPKNCDKLVTMHQRGAGDSRGVIPKAPALLPSLRESLSIDSQQETHLQCRGSAGCALAVRSTKPPGGWEDEMIQWLRCRLTPKRTDAEVQWAEFERQAEQWRADYQARCRERERMRHKTCSSIDVGCGLSEWHVRSQSEG